MKYRIIWRPHKIYYTKVLIRFYMSLPEVSAIHMTKGRSQLGHEHESWSNLTQWDLVLRQKTNFIQFPFSWISQVKSHSLLSSFRCLVCCLTELLWMWDGCSFTVDQILSDTVITIKISGGKHNNHSYHTLFSYSWLMNW